MSKTSADGSEKAEPFDGTKKSIRSGEVTVLSERDTELLLNMLANPPSPNSRLIAAAKALPIDR